MAAVFPRALTARFSPQSVLGRGGMGTVFAARDLKLGRRVAVKLLTTHGQVGAEAAERFEAEGRALGRISHPSVVAVYDTGFADGAPYLVMEFLDGTDVTDLVGRTGRRTAEQARHIALETLAGLEAAHDSGVLHRDVKPSNIRVTASGRVVLHDFGLARLSDQDAVTAPGELIGTPLYMAPEIVTGRPPSAASDVYGVGLCLYFMLTGTVPFGAPDGTVASLLDQVVYRGLPPLRQHVPGVSRAIEEAVGALAARDPVLRPGTAAAAAAVIRAGFPPELRPAEPRSAEPGPAEPAAVRDRDARTSETAHESAPVALPGPGPGADRHRDREPAPRPEAQPRYDWRAVDVVPARRPAAEQPALSDVTRRLFHSRMTERTALSRQREAVGLVLRGDLQEAADVLAGVAPYCHETLGADHPTTLACQYWQAVCHARLGAPDKAVELFARVSAHNGQERDTDDA
ncbi:serine/threonine-protein kinase [Streptomyces subrutilus]|uniref:serine/threonine-protein kinase n=1 Tax=Streptomyces subrutilus TaxID=36818 RepID=UPI002E1518EF|nr:protein kinase [Streptomyces subrutilus]